MPANEREWSKKPLPAERIEPGNLDFSDIDPEDYELSMTADGFEIKRKEDDSFGWSGAAIWIVLLIVAGWFW